MLLIPKKVPIFGRDIHIHYKELPHDVGAWGTFDNGTNTIDLDNSMEGEILFDTFCHEIIHAILHLSGHTHLLTEKQEEAICDSVGKGMADAMRAVCLHQRKYNKS